jgi:predicted nuclease of restriction endonuclease-like (RecB) superfamily
MDFKLLLQHLHQTHDFMQNRAASIVNQSLTLRNWLYGFYIVEYEQNGEDYAQYGSGLLKSIVSELKKGGITGIAYTNLTLFRKFYLQYPHIGLVIKELPELYVVDKNAMRIFQTPSEILKSGQTLPPDFLLKKLSFSHFVELLKADDPIQRLFYEVECIKGNWTLVQLQRQMGTLLYERTGLSLNKEALLAQIASNSAPVSLANIIRDPYMFEFTGLKTNEVFAEKALEKALLDHLQDFLLELGTGFCFEARQKSFLIDNRRYKIDLLFYHRILKCHVMIDLKTEEFSHEDAGQMNFYLNHHIDNDMQEDDNPPIGIILCSLKNETVVRYATGALDNQIFVSKYMLQLPDEKTLLNFINNEKRHLLGIGKAKRKGK